MMVVRLPFFHFLAIKTYQKYTDTQSDVITSRLKRKKNSVVNRFLFQIVKWHYVFSVR